MAGLTVLGNLAVDRVDGAEPTPGGCPAFVGPALAAAPGGGRVVTRRAAGDAGLFARLLDTYPVAVTVLAATTTDRFLLDEQGDARRVVVVEVGDPWSVADIEAAAIDTEWVHLAPLVRDQFPLATLRHLARAGHRLSFDGQGLVRPPAVGEIRPDARFAPGVLETVTVLKLAQEEAATAAGAHRPEEVLAARGVLEVVVTRGAGGCTLRVGTTTSRLAPDRPVVGVHATGAGDVFAVTYAAHRASGWAPVAAARAAGARVADLLEDRRRAAPPAASPAPVRDRRDR